MAEKNLSFVIYGKNDLRLENRPIREPKDNEVVLRMSHVGLCGTERPVIRDGSAGPGFDIKQPVVMGHEGSGIVEKCGSKVTSLKPGDRVAVIPVIQCSKCEFCVKGDTNICPNLRINLPPSQGMMQRFYTHEAQFCMKLPDKVSMEVGAMHEPLSVAVYACSRANLTPASRVLICGSGSIGLLILQVIKTMGATKICLLDIVDKKLKLAEQIGATASINTLNVKESEIAGLVKAKFGGVLPDVAFECTGTEPGIGLCIEAVHPGGRVVQVGLPAKKTSIPLYSALTRNVNIIMSWLFPHSFERANDLLASGKLDLKPIISHRFTLENAHEAYDIFMKGTDDPTKIMISL